MSDITWIMENIIVHYNTEDLNLKIVLFPWERNRNAGQSIRKEKSLGEIPKGQYYEAITHPW